MGDTSDIVWDIDFPTLLDGFLMSSASPLRYVSVRAIGVFLSAMVLVGATDITPSVCATPLKLDFSTYWLAARFLLTGGDPYDPNAFGPFAASFGCKPTGPSYIFPWFLVGLFPLAMLPLSLAALIWFLINLAMVLDLTTWTLKNFVGQSSRKVLTCLTLAASPGILLCLFFGQFGILCLWGISLVARSFKQDGIQVSLAIIIGSLKPQLAWLFWAFVGTRLITGRKFKTIAGAGAILLLSIGFVVMWSPGSYDSWRRVYGGGLNWMGASVITPLRILSATANEPAPILPVIIIMTVALLLAIYRLRKAQYSSDLTREIPWLVALSICASPYVWSLDFCVLLPAEIVALSPLLRANAERTIRERISIILVTVARMGLLAHLLCGVIDWSTWWYPLVITGALFFHSGFPRSLFL